uniref:Uncharacterized protein n=1 Tax=Setaria italica TaxID=4555 RepID=K3ZYD2_SETIT
MRAAEAAACEVVLRVHRQAERHRQDVIGYLKRIGSSVGCEVRAPVRLSLPPPRNLTQIVRCISLCYLLMLSELAMRSDKYRRPFS